jgi:hypothetical protein
MAPDRLIARAFAAWDDKGLNAYFSTLTGAQRQTSNRALMQSIPIFSILIATAASLLAIDVTPDGPQSQEKSASLPAPVSKETFTFQQIEQQKHGLKDKIVLIEIALVGDGGDIGNNMLRYFAEDTSGSAMPYGRVDIPREGLEKMRLAQSPHSNGPFKIYARVHVFPEKKAAAICVAIGMHFSVEHGKAPYSW